MPDQVMQLKARAPLKAFMVLTVLFALCASWFVVRWYLGNTMRNTSSPETRRLEVAQWRPTGPERSAAPLAHWQHHPTRVASDQIAQSVAEYEKAVSLSPNDYRFWMSLGEAQEQAGDFENAENHCGKRSGSLPLMLSAVVSGKFVAAHRSLYGSVRGVA